MGAVVVWMRREHQPRSWGPTNNPRAMRSGGAFRPPYHPRRAPAGWTGQRFRLGKNEGVFDAEPYAILRASSILGQRQETRVEYTIFSDSTAAIERVCIDQPGPGQALVRAIIGLERLITERKTTETRTQCTREWIRGHVNNERRYRLSEW